MAVPSISNFSVYNPCGLYYEYVGLVHQVPGDPPGLLTLDDGGFFVHYTLPFDPATGFFRFSHDFVENPGTGLVTVTYTSESGSCYADTLYPA